MPRALVILAVLAFILSVVLSFHWQFRPRVDAGAYDAIGWNVARGYGYVEYEENRHAPERDDAIVRVGPGYEFFLAGIYKTAGHKVSAVWVLQALLHALSMIIIYRLALLVFPALEKNMALLAATLFGFSPDLIFINSMLLTEGLFLFLLMASVYATFYMLERSASVWAWGIVGTLWALAILTRPVALVPFLMVCVVLAWQRRRLATALLVLPALILIGSWSWIMSARYDTFVLTTTAGGLDLWVGNNPGATGGFVKTPEIQAFRDTHHSVEVESEGIAQYVSFLTESPAQFLELQIRKTALYFSMIRPTGLWLDLQFFPYDRLALLFSSAFWTMGLFLAGIAGMALMIMQQPRDVRVRLFVLFAVLQPLVVIPIIVETRYRYALFPFLAIAGAYLVGSWLRGMSARTAYSVLMWPAGMLLVLTLYDISKNMADITAKIVNVLL